MLLVLKFVMANIWKGREKLIPNQCFILMRSNVCGHVPAHYCVSGSLSRCAVATFLLKYDFTAKLGMADYKNSA